MSKASEGSNRGLQTKDNKSFSRLCCQRPESTSADGQIDAPGKRVRSGRTAASSRHLMVSERGRLGPSTRQEKARQQATVLLLLLK